MGRCKTWILRSNRDLCVKGTSVPLYIKRDRFELDRNMQTMTIDYLSMDSRSSLLVSSSLSSRNPSSSSRLNLLSEMAASSCLAMVSLRLASTLKPTMPSPSSSSNKLSALWLAYLLSAGCPNARRRHDIGSRKFINASETRSRSEDVCEEIALRGRY
jgi:hypothetical protein